METTCEKPLLQRFDPVRPVQHIRKNHALEHATIHVLTKKFPGASFGGYSIHNGFWIFGECDIQSVDDAAEIAHGRLLNGEKNLAVHPNCGTNLAAAGLLCAAGSLIATAGAENDKDRLDRFSGLALAGILGTYFGKPLGMKVQKHLTTDPDVSDVAIMGVHCTSMNDNQTAFFIETSLI